MTSPLKNLLDPSPGAGPPVWRLLCTPPRGAAWNMALDHALAERIGRGDSPPALRFYGWDPPAVSIGYGQRVRGVRERLEALRACGLDAVRRPTGGRAVLHADEVTYSVVAPAHLPAVDGGVRASCTRIHAAILAGLESLGLTDLELHGMRPRARPTGLASRSGAADEDAGPPLESGSVRGRGKSAGRDDGCRPSPAAELAEPSCFRSPSQSEITWRGRKLVGSAQRRLQGAILQHGSILLGGDQRLLESVWPERMAGSGLANLEQAGGRRFGFDEVAEAVRLGFERVLDATLGIESLDPLEEERVECLAHGVYGRDEFLYRL